MTDDVSRRGSAPRNAPPPIQPKSEIPIPDTRRTGHTPPRRRPAVEAVMRMLWCHNPSSTFLKARCWHGLEALERHDVHPPRHFVVDYGDLSPHFKKKVAKAARKAQRKRRFRRMTTMTEQQHKIATRVLERIDAFPDTHHQSTWYHGPPPDTDTMVCGGVWDRFKRSTWQGCRSAARSRALRVTPFSPRMNWVYLSPRSPTPVT